MLACRLVELESYGDSSAVCMLRAIFRHSRSACVILTSRSLPMIVHICGATPGFLSAEIRTDSIFSGEFGDGMIRQSFS